MGHLPLGLFNPKKKIIALFNPKKNCMLPAHFSPEKMEAHWSFQP
jgi:hypothetical protein